jgi:hypothetical protein
MELVHSCLSNESYSTCGKINAFPCMIKPHCIPYFTLVRTFWHSDSNTWCKTSPIRKRHLVHTD